jgi:hypothetical protein
MKSTRIQAFLALIGVLALAACDAVGTGPALDDLTVQEQQELEVLSDPGSFDIALELTETTSDVASDLGHMQALHGRSLNAQARARFAEARAAMLNGDHRAALDAARLARRLVAEALREMGGDAALEALIERIEELALGIDEEDFDDPDAVRAELESLAAEARQLLADGDTLAAAARAILAEQRARHRRHPNPSVDRVRLAVSLAGTAVSLAERLIAQQSMPVRNSGSDVADRQNRWLGHARRLLAKSEAALAAGNLRRALHLAQHAQWSALKAVILPGGIQDEELRAMVVLAEDLYGQAVEALGDDPTDLDARLLARTADLIELGIQQLERGHKRGVAALWRAAVISAWLIR